MDSQVDGDMTIRERQEQLEENTLSSYAALAKSSRGRARAEEPCDLRTDYCRDRDRIIHCKAFRRLKQKTQVFLSPQGDHFRTRMTHTLEVSQIARTIARALRLNEDLTEAIAMGHDLGHTPFGHAGEQALDELSSFGFQHFDQSVRVVTTIEKDHKGLNLTAETLDGFARHTKGPWPETLEGCVVRYSDRIAFLNHDIEDAISAGILREEDLPSRVSEVLGTSKSKRITCLITALVENFDGGLSLPEEIDEAYGLLGDYMYERIYLNRQGRAKIEEHKVFDLIARLFEAYMKDPALLPDYYRYLAEREGIERAVVDYISGMSDEYAVHRFEELYIPKPWGYQQEQ